MGAGTALNFLKAITAAFVLLSPSSTRSDLHILVSFRRRTLKCLARASMARILDTSAALIPFFSLVLVGLWSVVLDDDVHAVSHNC